MEFLNEGGCYRNINENQKRLRAWYKKLELYLKKVSEGYDMLYIYIAYLNIIVVSQT